MKFFDCQAIEYSETGLPPTTVRQKTETNYVNNFQLSWANKGEVKGSEQSGGITLTIGQTAATYHCIIKLLEGENKS